MNRFSKSLDDLDDLDLDSSSDEYESTALVRALCAAPNGAIHTCRARVTKHLPVRARC